MPPSVHLCSAGACKCVHLSTVVATSLYGSETWVVKAGDDNYFAIGVS